MAEVPVSKKPKWGRIFRLTVGFPPNQVIIEDLFTPETVNKARRIFFNITANLESYIQNATIQVYNLDPAEVKLITQIKSPVILQAGYKDVHGNNPPVIYTGNVEYPNSQRAGLDIVTTLTCFSYRDSLSGIPQLSYESGTSLSQVFSDLSLVDNEGKPLPYSIIGDSLKSAVLKDDYTSGLQSAREVIDYFAVNFNFNWWCDIVTKQLMIVEKASPLKKNQILLVDASTGLMKEPELDYDGLTFETSLEPSLRYKDIVRIKYPRGISTFNIGENENLRALDSALIYITNVTHSGDSRGDEWKTSARGNWYRG